MSEEIKQDDVIAEEVVAEETVVEEVETQEVTSDDAPLTEARTISAINAQLAEMSKDDLDSILEASKDKAKVEMSDDDEEEDEDDEEGEVETEKKVEKKESKKVQKEEAFKADVDALVEGEDLSEDFKAKASTIFESALHAKLKTEVSKLEERYASDLEGEVKAIKEDLVDKVDGYLNYVVENWMTDNEVAIEHSLKSEITESFINAMHNVFTEHYINVPEDKADIVDALTEEATDAKAQLAEVTDQAKELSEKVKAFERAEIVAEACEGLAATEADKLKELAEGIEASDNQEFSGKLATIKESYMKVKQDATEEKVDAISEDAAEEETQVIDATMSSYLDAIKNTSK